MNTTPLFNRSAVKAHALRLSQEHRAGKFTRVGEDFLLRVHAKLTNILYDEVKRHPSVGKTLL